MAKGGFTVLVNVIAALEALFYLCAIPIHLAVTLEGLRAGTGLSAFEWRAARRRAARDMAKEPGKGDKGPDFRRTIKLLGRLRMERVRLAGRLSLGDAAATALACGAINGLTLALSGRAGRVESDVRPDFGSGILLRLDGMIRARAGQIILAVIRVSIEEAFPWITTPLKT